MLLVAIQNFQLVHVVMKYIITKGFALHFKGLLLTLTCFLKYVQETIVGFSKANQGPFPEQNIACMDNLRPSDYIQSVSAQYVLF
jgi:hypothetical protein